LGPLEPFARQVVFAPLGLDGQRSLMRGRVLMVGVGGLGSWVAQLLTRSGVGHLRLVDPDRVDVTNIHRQCLYTQADARARAPKVTSAARRLVQIRPEVQIEPIRTLLSSQTALELCRDVDLIVDGTDNFASRMLINDVAVRNALPWVMAGVVGSEGQCATFLPGVGACLRCLMDAPPPACKEPTCRNAGVLAPAVSALASMQAMEAIKILSGRSRVASGYLTKLDLWSNTVQRIDLAGARDPQCACCGRRIWEYLEP
jgi:adenylyltransferase/sulfurtransferase